MEICRKNKAGFLRAQQVLTEGGVIAYASDTIYGLGCLPENKAAVEELYKLKKRKADKSCIILIPPFFNIGKFVLEINSEANLLISCFWPGPLTLVFKAKNLNYHPFLLSRSGSDSTIALRMPDDKKMICMLNYLGPIVSTSVNISGQPALNSADEIKAAFPQLPMIIEGAVKHKPSTVIDVSGLKPRLIREGAITKKDIYKATKIVL